MKQRMFFAAFLIVAITATSYATTFSCPTPEELTSDFNKYGAIPPTYYRYNKDGVTFRIINPPDKMTSFVSVSVIYDLKGNLEDIICDYRGIDWFERDVNAVVSIEESNIEPRQISFREALDSADRSVRNEHGSGYLWKKNIEFTINPNTP